MSRDKLTTRDRILQSAWRLLETDPGHGVRMSDIAKDAGISRQALYLHYPTRADLLIATTRYLDEIKNVDERLAPSRSAETGPERLDAFIEAWGNYVPEIYGVAKALLAMKDSDEAADAAWNDRMQAVRHGCKVAVKALARDKLLVADLTEKQATDLLWTWLSIRNWEHLTRACGWSQQQYIRFLKSSARRMLLSDDI